MCSFYYHPIHSWSYVGRVAGGATFPINKKKRAPLLIIFWNKIGTFRDFSSTMTISTNTNYSWHTFINSSKSSVIHLIGTVEDDHVFTQTPSHVFCSFRLSGSSWTCRSSTKSHTQGLSDGDITSERHNTLLMRYKYPIQFT